MCCACLTRYDLLCLVAGSLWVVCDALYTRHTFLYSGVIRMIETSFSLFRSAVCREHALIGGFPWVLLLWRMRVGPRILSAPGLLDTPCGN